VNSKQNNMKLQHKHC